MGFRGREFAFESPAAAVAGLIAHAASDGTASCAQRASEAVPLDTARGRFLAEPIVCDRDSPAFDYAAMDGYAVRATDVRAAAAHAVQRGERSVTLTVVGESRIGTAPPPLPALALLPQQTSTNAPALRIATGAAIPTGQSGADAIIKREDVTEHTDGAGDTGSGVRAVTLALDVAERLAPGDHIRRRGENARAGDAVLQPGVVLTASSLGALAAVGHTTPRVFTRLRVALITTGDELVAAHETPGAFQIRNSNAAAIAAILASQAWIDLMRVCHLDDGADLACELREATSSEVAEAVILTGGVSMGHRDPVHAAVESIGAGIVFHGLPQRPGKPMLAAVLRARSGHAVPIVGLPGNPVSAMITCTRIVLPALAAYAGGIQTPADLLPRAVTLHGDDGKRLGFWWHRPVTLSAREGGVPVAELVRKRGSGDMISAAQSDGFVELSPARDTCPGDEAATLVPFYPWPA